MQCNFKVSFIKTKITYISYCNVYCLNQAYMYNKNQQKPDLHRVAITEHNKKHTRTKHFIITSTKIISWIIHLFQTYIVQHCIISNRIISFTQQTTITWFLEYIYTSTFKSDITIGLWKQNLKPQTSGMQNRENPNRYNGEVNSTVLTSRLARTSGWNCSCNICKWACA